MARRIASQIHNRAGDVRQDGKYCGLFELTVWSELKDVRILLAYGKEILDVHHFCIKDVPRVSPDRTMRIAAVYRTAAEDLSADNPDAFHPEANHFLAANEQAYRIGLNANSDSSHVRRYNFPGKLRRTAEQVAYDIGWRLVATALNGDCLIDAFAYHAGVKRDPITWKRIRNELADRMEHIATVVDWEGDEHPWAKCFRLCGEDDILPRLHAAPLVHKDASPG